MLLGLRVAASMLQDIVQLLTRQRHQHDAVAKRVDRGDLEIGHRPRRVDHVAAETAGVQEPAVDVLLAHALRILRHGPGRPHCILGVGNVHHIPSVIALANHPLRHQRGEQLVIRPVRVRFLGARVQ